MELMVHLLVAASLVVFSGEATYNAVLQTLDEDEWWGVGDKSESDNDTTIYDYTIQWSDELINDLKYRLKNRRPSKPSLEGVAFEYGFNAEYLETILDYWLDKYNFTERLAYFNQYPQYKTEIQGLDLHFIWVKPNVSSSSVTVLPLLLLHGWPGSIREFYEVIPLLTTEREEYDYVFEVVVPSLPGFGFSEATTRAGLGPVEVAVMLRNLMHRIGHHTFYIQGGDWGSVIGSDMATIFPEEVLGYHTNMPSGVNAAFKAQLALGEQFPEILPPLVRAAVYPLATWQANYQEEIGYSHLQSTKPDTIGVSISDSPSGLAAYLLEKVATGTSLSNRALSDGGLSRYSEDTLLDLVMVYWASGSITSSFRLYKEYASTRTTAYNINEISTVVPTWALHMAHDPLLYPAQFMRSKYTRLVGVSLCAEGGHYAALQRPALLADDVWAAHHAFQTYYSNNTTLLYGIHCNVSNAIICGNYTS